MWLRSLKRARHLPTGASGDCSLLESATMLPPQASATLINSPFPAKTLMARVCYFFGYSPSHIILAHFVRRYLAKAVERWARQLLSRLQYSVLVADRLDCVAFCFQKVTLPQLHSFRKEQMCYCFSGETPFKRDLSQHLLTRQVLLHQDEYSRNSVKFTSMFLVLQNSAFSSSLQI